jgi:uncharacterized protein (UPF0261 family)
MLPTKGVSMLDDAGKAFHDAEADRALFQSLREHASEGANVRVLEMDAHINDEVFAHAMADQLLAMLQSPANQKP